VNQEGERKKGDRLELEWGKGENRRRAREKSEKRGQDPFSRSCA
jgi:hypothetical protein